MKKLLCFLMTMIIALSCSYSSFAAEDLKFGDVNSDGKINSEDALLILEYATLIRDLDDEQKLLADVSDDGTINSYDALMVLEYSVGIINSFPAEKVEETLSVEEIVEIYNTAANKTKAYTGTMKLHAVQGASAKIVETSFPNAVVSMANGLLPNDYPTEKDYEITDGKDKASGDKIEDLLLPIEGSKKMSELKADGVQSAACEIKDGKYYINIVLKPETVTSLSQKPVNHNSCMLVLNISDDDLKPFTMNEFNAVYTGGTIAAVINENGLLDSYDSYNPIMMNGTLKWSAISGSVKLDTSWKQKIEFTYYK